MNRINFWKNLTKPFTVLAPMDDVTDFAFREIIATELPVLARPDVYFTEFASTEALTSRGYDNQIRRFKYSENERPIVAQIWGTNPEKYFKVAKIVEDFKFDGVDINMGCPDKTITKNGSCSALIENPSLAKEIIQAVKEATVLPVSVKTRIGFKTKKTESWIGLLLEQKLDALTIHGRTAKDMSLVPADWSEIFKGVELKNSISPDTIIIGNGDVKNYKEVVEKYNNYKVDGVMIGRGIFKNIYAFDKTNRTEYDEVKMKQLFLKHLNLFYNTWGNTKNIAIIKKFAKVYINSYEGSSDFRAKIMECKTYQEMIELIL